MLSLLQTLKQNYQKALLFALYGGIGCLIIALILGEWFLHLTELPPLPKTEQKAVILLIDSSSSMNDGKLEEVKTAAINFINRRDFSKEQLGVINFGETVNIITSLSTNQAQLNQGIKSLQPLGGTPMAAGIKQAIASLSSTDNNRYILLFTDGMPQSQFQAILAANKARNQSILMIVVATGDADIQYLTRLTGDPNLVFYANSGEIDQGFRQAELAINNQQLLESKTTGNYSLTYSSLRTGGWTAIITLGLSLTLIVAQNHYLHRRLLTIKETFLILIGSTIAGLIAGGIGSSLFTILTNLPNSELIAGVINWGIAGTITFVIINSIRRNIPLKEILIRGFLLGIIAAVALIFTIDYLGDAGILIAGFIVGCGVYYTFYSKGLAWFFGIIVLFSGSWLLLPSVNFSSALEIAIRLIAWTILGAIVALGISYFIPNLQRLRAFLGGSLGGSLASIGFLLMSLILTQFIPIETSLADRLGRLIGASILGFCIGLMIFWEEERQLQKSTYLLIRWNDQESRKILLGEIPIWLGSSLDAQIALSKTKYPDKFAKIFKAGNQVFFEFHSDYAQAKGIKITPQEWSSSQSRTFDGITLTIVDETR